MKPVFDEKLPLIVNGEPFWILPGPDDKPMLLQHADDAAHIVAITDDELLAGLTDTSIRFAYLRHGTREEG